MPTIWRWLPGTVLLALYGAAGARLAYDGWRAVRFSGAGLPPLLRRLEMFLARRRYGGAALTVYEEWLDSPEGTRQRGGIWLWGGLFTAAMGIAGLARAICWLLKP